MESNQDAVSVVVVDDDRFACEAMSRHLTRNGYQVTPLFDGRSALAHVVEREPEVLVIDHFMPGLSGTKVIEEIAERHLPTVTMLITGAEERKVVRGAFRAGAVDVLFKPILFGKLSNTVEKAVAHGQQRRERCQCLGQLKDAVDRLSSSSEMHAVTDEPPPDTVIRVGDLEVDQQQRRVFSDGRLCELTTLEFRVLLHLARHVNQLVTHQSIAKAARGHSMERWEAREFTKQHIRKIRRKIGDTAQCPRYIHTVHGQGYRLALL